MVLGVSERELGETFARSLREGGVERAFVVCGKDPVAGLDEVSCAGETWGWELSANGEIKKITIHPRDFGLPVHPLTSVAGGSPSENAQTFTTLLTSGENIPENLIPVLDFVLMNAAVLLVVSGVAKDFREGAELARKSVVSGKAWEALELFKREGVRLAAAAAEGSA